MAKKSTATSNDVAVVPFGTTVISLEVTNFVKRYNTLARKTSESIVELGKTLREAKEDLSADDFTLFCDEVKIKKNGPTYKKLMAIGGASSRFDKIMDKLPNNWTTIYKLSALEVEDFKLVEPDLTPATSARDINKKLNRNSTGNANQNKFMLSFEKVEPTARDELYQKLIELKKQFGFDLKIPKEFDSESSDDQDSLE